MISEMSFAAMQREALRYSFHCIIERTTNGCVVSATYINPRGSNVQTGGGIATRDWQFAMRRAHRVDNHTEVIFITPK
jgi:hypothetical protein